jgi:hypothetical protein
MKQIIKDIYEVLLLLLLLLSLYMFVDVFIYKNNDKSNTFSTWQLSMLLALYLELKFGF